MDDSVTALLAVAMVLRGTRLAATDVITEPLRRPLKGWVLKLVTCGWCASIWISVLIVAPSWMAWRHELWWQAVGIVAAGSWLAGVTHGLGSGAAKPVAVSVVRPVDVMVDHVPDLEIEDDDAVDGDA